MGIMKGTECSGALTDRVVAFIEKNPGCTSGEVRRAIGTHSAQAILPALVDKGILYRKSEPSKDTHWHYYVALG